MSSSELYFSFNGRIGRQTFWIHGVLLLAGIYLVALLLDALFGAEGGLLGLITLLLIWPQLAIQAKRWHDRDKSAWWLLISLIPFVGAIWALIELGFLEGTHGPNQYGPDPSAGAISTSNRSLSTASTNLPVPQPDALDAKPAATTQATMAERLSEASRLKEQGLLTETEYNDLRRNILGLG